MELLEPLLERLEELLELDLDPYDSRRHFLCSRPRRFGWWLCLRRGSSPVWARVFSKSSRSDSGISSLTFLRLPRQDPPLPLEKRFGKCLAGGGARLKAAKIEVWYL